MATPRARLRLVLIQVREGGVPLRQEQGCFIERCRLARRQFRFINVVDEPQIRWQHVQEAHAVIIGGAGAYSVTEHHPFTEPLREVLLELIERDRPVFGSCWGHQFMAAATGGSVIEDPERTEIGSLPLRLTATGRNDPLFEGLPDRFYVQLGHKDRVTSLADGWLDLAATDLCPYQAIRLADKPVYGTQFHSEMNEDRLRERLDVYCDSYVPEREKYLEIIRRLRPSIEADGLMRRFLELYA
jgi:GMP synthase (glutamine-hydrolysing)